MSTSKDLKCLQPEAVAEALFQYGWERSGYVRFYPKAVSWDTNYIEKEIGSVSDALGVKYKPKKKRKLKMFSKWQRYTTALRKTVWLGNTFPTKGKKSQLAIKAHELHHIIWQRELGVWRWVALWLADEESRLLFELGGMLAAAQVNICLSDDRGRTAKFEREHGLASRERLGRFLKEYRIAPDFLGRAQSIMGHGIDLIEEACKPETSQKGRY